MITARLSAIIFDSQYDAYRGVIVYIRVMDGKIKPGDRIKMMGTGAEFTVLETGFLKPLGFELCKELSAGEVGFFTAGIKNVRDTQVGDTVTNADKPAEKPLPGYRKVTPMVFSGVYPADGAKYPDLRDALEKLKLNDASLTFEPESSTALGFGFRCGFLGLLHMEIIQERLEREYGLDLITTAPSVVYKYAKPTVPMSISTTRSNTRARPKSTGRRSRLSLQALSHRRITSVISWSFVRTAEASLRI